MEFKGEFLVPGHARDVIVGFTDIGRMARCLPGASLEGQDEEGNHIGVMTVSFGPKKLKFKGRMRCDFDLDQCSGKLHGRGATDGRAARVSFETGFTVTDAPAEAEIEALSLVRILATVEMGGVIADFAATGGAALANVLMKEFAKNLAIEFTRSEVDAVVGDAKPLSATKLLWGAVKTKFS